MRKSASVAVVVCAFGVFACSASIDDEGSSTLRAGSDLFVVGADVRLTGPASGDVIAAGERVELAEAVAGDTLAAGRALTLIGPFASDLYAAGAQVDVEGAVDGSLRAAGESVRLGPQAQLGAGVSIAASAAEIGGTLEDYLQVAAGTTHLEANVAGDVDVAGRSLEVGPASVIGGSLTFRGPEPPTIAPGAQIAGETRHITQAADTNWSPVALAAVFAFTWVLGLTVVANLAYIALPELSRSVGIVVRERPGRSLLIGATISIAAPLGIACAFLSVIGLPLGLLALYLYLLLMPAGYLTSCMAIADQLLDSARPDLRYRAAARSLALVVVLLVLAGLSYLPWLGMPLGLLLTIIGVGGLASALWNVVRPGRPARAAVETAHPSKSDLPQGT